MIIIVAVPAAGIMVYSGKMQRNEAVNEARRQTQRLADTIASEQKNLVNAAQQLVSALAQLPEVKTHNSARVQSILGNILKINPQYLNIFVADRNGAIWATALPLKVTFSIEDRLYFKSAIARGRFSSGEYIVGRLLAKPTFSFGYPIKNAKGGIDGVIAVNINLEHFRNILEHAHLPPRSGHLLIDHNGVILSGGINPAAYIGKPDQLELFKRMQQGPDGDTFVSTGLDGSKRFITYRTLYLSDEQTPYMYVRATIPVGVAVSKANAALIRNLSLFATFLFAALFLAWLIGKRSIVDRISALQQVSQRLAGGDLRARVSDLVTGGELGELGRAFDDMASALEKDISKRELVERALHEQAARLEKEMADRQMAQEDLAIKQLQLEEFNHSLEERIDMAITELRQKDQMLIQQGRLAAMGEMINNIAHQWRQPLNNIGLIVQSLIYSHKNGELTESELEGEIGKTMDTINFMSRTIDDFRSFFRQDKEKRYFTTLDMVNKTMDFVAENLRYSNITVKIESQDSAAAFGYPNEYAQVLINIINNAKDALLEQKIDEPRIRIRVFSEDELSVVTVWDNGGGVADHILPKIFDPYFSTKEPGKGTGIGLYMSKVIIEQHMKGNLTARNHAGGTEFRIAVPSASESAAPLTQPL